MNYDIKINKYGDKYYCVNNVLHREDGPAIEYSNGGKQWYKNGQCHREDGPAIEHPNGVKKWYKNGKLHRENGPACDYADAGKEWYLNDISYGINNQFTNESWIRFVKTLIFS